MIDAEYLAKEEIEDLDREYGLPETDEMETEWNTSEDFVLLNRSDNLLCYIFRLENRDEA